MTKADKNMADSERKEIRTAFRKAANMASRELHCWLESEESQSVGWTREGKTKRSVTSRAAA
jgi:hypothetical protein